jgi:hypothetical protein
MSEDLDLCSTCKTGYLTPTGEVAVQGESAGEFEDIGDRRVYSFVKIVNRGRLGLAIMNT